MAAVDRISELPEPILHHILSFLSQKEATQTSTFSRTWRHVGPTRPKIEFRESCFPKFDRASFLSVIRKTLQRYYHRHLPVHEFIFELSSKPKSKSKSDCQLIDSEFTSNPGKTLFKGLKRLSLSKVHIKDETTLDLIMRSCPLIEYLLVYDCAGLKTIPLTIFQAEFLAELHLTRCRLIATDQLLLFKSLKTLSLERVYIAEETLEKIMCGCPLIESLLLADCEGLCNIKLIEYNNNLKHFSLSLSSSFYGETQSFEIDAPTIETISIVECLNWYGHDKYFFPHLKTLYLSGVKLSAELFESFSSSNFPSLEDLELELRHGLPEIQLTICSIKRLVLKSYFKNPIKATIYAPNIHYFKFSGPYPPQLFLHSGTTREWKSNVDMWFNNWLGDLAWLRQLLELLISLRKSQISLEVYNDQIENLKLEETNDVGFCKPVPLEEVHIKGYHLSSSFQDLLNCLFLICQPRYIVMNLYNINPYANLKREKDNLAELMTFKTIRNEGEMSCCYLWERYLEEISMQVWDHNSKVWHTVGVDGTCFPGFKTSYPRIRFSVKWED